MKSYDNLARWYLWLERAAFGNLLTRVRDDVLNRLLDDLQRGQRVLILGEGDGRFLQNFSLQAQVACQVDCVDKSRAMLARARARLQPSEQLELTFIQADVTQGIPTNGQYDAVVSIFFLDNFTAETLEQLSYDLSQRLQPGGRWYLADFRAGSRHWHWHWRNRLWLWLMYRFFRVTTDIEARSLVDPTSWLEAHLTLQQRHTWQGSFVVSETWQRPLEALEQD